MARVPSPSIGGGRVGASDISVVQTRRQNIDFSPLARGLESQADDGGLAEGFDAVAQVSAQFAKEQQATEEETEFGALKLELRKRLFTIQNGDPANATPGYRDIAGQNAVDGSADVIARIRAAEAEVTAKAQFERNKGRLATANGFSTLDALRSHSTYVNEARKQAFAAVNGEAIQEAQNAILGSFEPVKVSTANLIDIEEAARNIAINAGAVPGTEQGDAIIEKAITDEKTKAITTVVNGLIDQDRVKEANAIFTGYKTSINAKAWGPLMTALNTKGVEVSAREFADEAAKAPTPNEGRAVLDAIPNLEVREKAYQKLDVIVARKKRVADAFKEDTADKFAACAEDPECNLEDFSTEQKTAAAKQMKLYAARDAQVKSGVPIRSVPAIVDEVWQAYTDFLDGKREKFLAIDFSSDRLIRGLNATDYKEWRRLHAAAFPTAEKAALKTQEAIIKNQDLAKFRSAIQDLLPSLNDKENANLTRYASITVAAMFEANPDRGPLSPKEWQDIALQGVADNKHKDNWFQGMTLSEWVATGMKPGFYLDKTNKEVMRSINEARDEVMKLFPGDTMSEASLIQWANTITNKGMPVTRATLLAEMEKKGIKPADNSALSAARARIQARDNARKAPARREAELKAAVAAEDADDAAQAQREADLAKSVESAPAELKAAEEQAATDAAILGAEIPVPGVDRDPVAEAEAAKQAAADEAELQQEIPTNIPEPQESEDTGDIMPETQDISTSLIPAETGETAPEILKPELVRIEGTGDGITGIPTGEGGIQLARKAAYEKQLGRSMSDREAREMAVDEDHNTLTTNLSGYSQLPANAQAVILDLAYNMGAAKVSKFAGLKKHVAAQDVLQAMLATLDTANEGGKTLKGIAVRRARAYNTVIQGNKAIVTVQQLDDGTISYWFSDGTEFKYRTNAGKHPDSKPGEVEVGV